ncbi:FtsX-like permease family protein [bacterium]|nr:MAG: FtsX-like permease family protein [bacterium]
MFDRVAFVLGETFIALRRNLLLGFAAITTTAISLYLLAGMFYIGSRASGYAGEVQQKFEMRVNLKEGTDMAGIQRTAKYLRLIPGVGEVTWIPRKQRWIQYKKENPDLTQGYGFNDNIFPDAFKVRLSDLSKTDAVVATAKKMTTVDAKEGVSYFGEAQNTVAQWLRFGQNLSYWIGGLLCAVAGIVILNAIRLAVESRRVEIRIMRLVGASRIVVNLPFVLEGMIQGTLGGALATLGIYFSQRIVEQQLAEFSVGASIAPFPIRPYLLALCAIGGGYGALCSLLALRTPMRARKGL